MNPLHALTECGQSIWLDYIRRSLITSGELERLVEDDQLRGVTSNPTIFQKTIAGSNDYDAALRQLLEHERSTDPGALYEALAVEDIRMAASVLRPVYDDTGGADGFVSLEVSPHLAHDTDGTIEEARRLWRAVDRPNVMIKVPATAAGIPAITALIADGINVNVTLMFSAAHYEAVAGAYIQGLKRSDDPASIASVASFFVSRVDGAVDRALDELGTSAARALQGKIAIANAKRVYQRFTELFHGDAFARLTERGARPQRVLWASTGTKNPRYSDVLYVEELIGPETVNTMPPATLNAFRDHGRVRPTVQDHVEDAAHQLHALAELGIHLDAIGEQLQGEGVAKFAESFDKLLQALDEKRRTLLSAKVTRQTFHLDGHQDAVRQRLDRWRAEHVCRRLWKKDPTIWFRDPVPEITNRLGWLDLHEAMHEQLDDLHHMAEGLHAENVAHVVLLGMGGSSLAPEVFGATFGNGKGYPRLLVLDSTHPTAVRHVDGGIDPLRDVFVVSSKSGTTLETLSLFRTFWDRTRRTTDRPGRHFIAITDPGTPLQQLAEEREFRHVVLAPPDVGGRYSALSVFGLVPAALTGIDVHQLLDRAWTMAEASSFCIAEPDNPSLTLGAALGELALAGRNKVTFLTSPALEAFPAWLEQLIAESTGKDGKGLVPIAAEPLGEPEVYGRDRLFVSLTLDGEQSEAMERGLVSLEAAGHPVVRIALASKADVAQEMFRWEMAVAAAGAVIGVHPFNQPDVQLAKDLARSAMEGSGDPADGEDEDAIAVGEQDVLSRALAEWARPAPGDYVAIQAYLAPGGQVTEALQRIRLALRDRLRVATTVGYGPRFLHSTGQLHKGGPNTGLFLQLIDAPEHDVAVPETDYGFAALIRAQALGDYGALRQRGRRVVRINLGGDVADGLARVLECVT